MTRFFFYGTLTHEHDNPVTRRVLPLLGPGRRGWVRGTIHAVPQGGRWYPVLRRGRGRVWGWLYEAGPRFDRATLRLLDAWEVYDPRRPDRSEYLRRPVRVCCGGRIAMAQAYVHNRPLHAGMRRITGGDFATFVKARRGKPLGAGA
jgi:gamma-glutamylcyclotransferase (GGCT)/AIG2-like uncharacterized protein YtfP